MVRSTADKACRELASLQLNVAFRGLQGVLSFQCPFVSADISQNEQL